MRKIFVIGFNKTASTTLHELFKRNDLKSFHGCRWPLKKYDCFSDTGSIPFFYSSERGDPKTWAGHKWGHEIRECWAVYHAGGESRFQNHPYENRCLDNLKRIEKKYKNSLFILNTRSLKKWLMSRLQHGILTLNAPCRNPKQMGRDNWAYPPSVELVKKWINDRNNYYVDVLNYFIDKPERLIILNVEDPNWVKFISKILTLDVNSIESKNVTKFESSWSGSEGGYESVVFLLDEAINSAFYQLGYADGDFHSNDEQQNTLLLKDMPEKPVDWGAMIYKNNL